MSRFQPDERVRHPAFGLGTVLRIEAGRYGDHEDGAEVCYAVLRFDYDPQTLHRIPDTQTRFRRARPKDEKEPFPLPRFRVGERVWHETFGLGRVQGIEHASNLSSYEVLFEADGKTRHIAPDYARWRAAGDLDGPRQRARLAETEARLAETFVPEPDEVERGHGARWSALFEGGGEELVRRLPEIVSAALNQTGFGDSRPGPYASRGVWANAVTLAWPIRMKGVQLLLDIGEKRNSLLSAFPFTAEGIEQRLMLERVIVWPNRAEAQIEARLGPASICFFDTAFAINRGWYLAGQEYQFVLAGLAYVAAPAKNEALLIPAASPGARALRRLQTEDDSGPTRIDPLRIETTGMAALLPTGGDRDDYQFHGPVVEVRETELLGEPAWRVRAVVLRESDAGQDKDIVLEILVTRRVWRGDRPPAVGEDIEGSLWLQGHLWLVHDQYRLHPL